SFAFICTHNNLLVNTVLWTISLRIVLAYFINMRLIRLHYSQWDFDVAKRRRAPGAGRKPKGEFHGMRNPLSIRITDALREKLDGACKGSGRSLTQEVTKRLNDSFAIKTEPDASLRAIQYLVGQCALFIGKDWKTNPWMFHAFRAAVSSIIE